MSVDPAASALAVECLAGAFGLSERTSLSVAEEFVPGGKEFFLEQSWKRRRSWRECPSSQAKKCPGTPIG